MNRRDSEKNAGGFLVGKADDALANGGLIEKTEFAIGNLRWDAKAGLRVEIVIIGEAVFGQDFENGQATLATKGVFMRVDARS